MPYSPWTIGHLNPPWKQQLFRRIRADMAAAAAAAAAAEAEAGAARPGPLPPPIPEEEPGRQAEASPVSEPAPTSEHEPIRGGPKVPGFDSPEGSDDVPSPEPYCLHTNEPLWGLDPIYEPATCEDFISHNFTHIITVMAKTAKLKRLAQSKSPHSRAAKRASSPSINLDKSLKNAVAPATNKPPHPSVLAVHRGAGITKRKLGKPLKRQQRRRQEKGMERAEAVMDKGAKKVEKGKAKERAVKERSAAWDEHNRKLPPKKREVAAKVEAEEDEMETEEEVEEAEWAKEEPGQEAVEEEMDEVL